MTDYHKKLTALQKQRQKLVDTEKALVQKRKAEIADLAEQFDLLTIDNKILTESFANIKEHSNELRTKTQDNPRHSSPTESDLCETENGRA